MRWQACVESTKTDSRKVLCFGNLLARQSCVGDFVRVVRRAVGCEGRVYALGRIIDLRPAGPVAGIL